MTDLGEILGMLMASVAHARRYADEETAAIAEYYKQHPLLEGMSLPRVRLPEVILDLPFLIESLDEGKPNVLNDLDKIRKLVSEELRKLAEREQLTLGDLGKHFDRELALELDWLTQSEKAGRGVSRETVIRAADNALARVLKEQVSPESLRTWQNQVAPGIRQIASKVALKEVGTPPKITASIITAEVKEKASAVSAPRLRLSIKEEGLEWSVGRAEDGTVTKKLVPE